MSLGKLSLGIRDVKLDDFALRMAEVFLSGEVKEWDNALLLPLNCSVSLERQFGCVCVAFT